MRFIAGPVVKMEPKTIQTLETFHTILGLQPLALAPPTKDPLKISTVAAAPDDLVQVVSDAAPGVEAPKSGAALGTVKGKVKVKDEGAPVQ